MARRTGFSAYKVVISNVRAREKWLLRLGGREDGYSLLKAYFESRIGLLIRLGEPNPETGEYVDNRALKLAQLEFTESDRLIEGIFLKGEAGVIKQVFDLDGEQNDDPSYVIGKTEADLTPLYFRFHLEDGHRFGIAILQTFGKDGLKGFLQDDLKRFGKSSHTIKLTQYLDEKALTALAKSGKLQDVILVNSGKKTTSRKRLRDTSVAGCKLVGAKQTPEGAKLTMRLHKGTGWPVKVITDLLSSRKKKDGLDKKLDTPFGEDYDDVCIEITQGGRKQTFSLLNPDDSPVRYDKTKDVTIGDNGYPTFDSLRTAGNDVWESVSSMLGWSRT